MASAQPSNGNLLLRIQNLLRRKPHLYDVVFCVGPARKKVKAVRILLEAASPALEKEFEFWDSANVRGGKGKGIPIPDFEPGAFEIFVKLTMLDDWTADALKNLRLQPEQIQNLISICRVYKIESGLRHLEDLMKSFYGASLDSTKIPLKTKARTGAVQSTVKTEVKANPLTVISKVADVHTKVERDVTPEFSTLSLTLDSPIVDSPPFVCDGKEKCNLIATKQRIRIYGFGFLGPINKDADYNVTIRIVRIEDGMVVFLGEPDALVTIEKRISATKGTIFRILLEKPVTLTEGSLESWTNYYRIFYSLKGPNTKSFQRKLKSVCDKPHGENGFELGWRSNQLAEILYTNV